ncbi:MAG TPA: hypothetical protein VIF83_06195 [Gemmatimonadaceae bacterium]|jgi:hypothetical protein
MAMMSGALARARALAGNPAALAMMMGAARASAEGRAKAIADDYASRTAKAKVSIDVDGEGRKTLTAKRVPVDDVDAQIQEAHEGPRRELLTTLGGTLDDLDREHAQQSAAQLDPEAIRNELSTHEGRVKLSLELGASSRRKAENDSVRIQNGEIPIERAIQQVLEKRAGKAREFLKRVDATNEKSREDARKRNNSVYSAIKSSDLDSVNVEDIASRASVDPKTITSNPEYLSAMKDRREQLTLAKAKGRRSAVNSTITSMKPEDVSGYESFDQWLGDQEAELGDLTPSERGRAKARFTGLKARARRQEEDQRFQRERQDAFLEKIAAGTKQKPAKISFGDARTIEVDDLVSLRGDDGIDQRSVDIAFRVRNGQITRELITLEGQRQKTRKLKTAGAVDDDKADADIEEMTTRINQLREDQKKLAKPKDSLGILAGGPNVGDRKTFPNGAVGEWDGKGWKQVTAGTQLDSGSGKFSAQKEAGIAAYMRAKGYGSADRQKAIEELKLAGRL